MLLLPLFSEDCYCELCYNEIIDCCMSWKLWNRVDYKAAILQSYYHIFHACYMRTYITSAYPGWSICRSDVHRSFVVQPKDNSTGCEI